MKSESDGVWTKAIFRLKHLIDSQSFKTWIVPIKFKSYENNTFNLEVPSRFYKRWVLSNYSEKIRNVLKQITQTDCDMNIICPDEDLEMDTPDMFLRASQTQSQETPAPSEDTQPGFHKITPFHSSHLNEQYTFDNFVIGESNRFAHAVAQASADLTTKAYNPLFIYGGVGLGKTHLMQGIGHQILKTTPNAKVIYITSEQFMNCFIDCISKNQQAEFRSYFRNTELLLVDDVQFLIGKDRTQTEFFHTFNALYDASKKIVISSDRPPKELASLEERLRSRFEWGIIVDIQPPELETRIAILKRKAESQGIALPSEVAYFIAERITSNIRELEGSLQRIKAYAHLHRSEITLELTKKLLAHLTEREKRTHVTIDEIVQTVADYFEIKPQDILGDRRQRKIAVPRHIAQYLAREFTTLSLPKIGQRFGGKDHTSVLHACRKIENLVKKDPNLKNIITYLTKLLNKES